jgi:hypothetical protein
MSHSFIYKLVIPPYFVRPIGSMESSGYLSVNSIRHPMLLLLASSCTHFWEWVAFVRPPPGIPSRSNPNFSSNFFYISLSHSTPSSSSQGATATAPPPAQWPITQNFGLFSALQNFGIDHHNNNHQHHGHGTGGPGEYLAHLSSSSLLSHPQQQNQQGRRPLSQEDEVKVFRSKHTDSSFSGSSRPSKHNPQGGRND